MVGWQTSLVQNNCEMLPDPLTECTARVNRVQASFWERGEGESVSAKGGSRAVVDHASGVAKRA